MRNRRQLSATGLAVIAVAVALPTLSGANASSRRAPSPRSTSHAATAHPLHLKLRITSNVVVHNGTAMPYTPATKFATGDSAYADPRYRRDCQSGVHPTSGGPECPKALTASSSSAATVPHSAAGGARAPIRERPLMLRTTTNMLPAELVRPDLHSERYGGPQLDLAAVSGGHDFMLQAANAICARAAFSSMKLPWIGGPIDAQAVAAISTDNSASAGTLRSWLASAGLGSGANLDVLVLLTPHDVVFDGPATCRARATAQIALGRLTTLAREPELSHGLAPGEAVQNLVDQDERSCHRPAGLSSITT
jgi:hypothetical protein